MFLSLRCNYVNQSQAVMRTLTLYVTRRVITIYLGLLIQFARRWGPRSSPNCSHMLENK